MTIKIERDAILSVVNSRQQSPVSTDSPSHCYPLSADSSCSRSYNETTTDNKSYFFELATTCSSKLDDDESQQPELDDTDDESTSTCTSSIISTSSSKGASVTFCEPLVTEVRTRPRTLKRHVRALFYTYEETQRFRQEYREERRLKALEEADSGLTTALSSGSGSSLLTKSGAPSSGSASVSTSTKGEGTAKSVWDGFSSQDIDKSSWSSHRISKVVVLHKNTLETFIDKEMDTSLGLGMGSPSSPCTPSVRDNSHSGKCKTASDNFFDNESFWSGQVTWY
eukprot:CAMPEP_0203683054 /NCGR_PEP_ID=MMETSP0090-20130426/47318_1 /ASSEMBLY_ACC=CAM_ASM_001088 /TAXON_ID=426623 /ORGANISM="Chaetoceros affinis, Strain CCMP159" /LENGTH=281 /DNA_ID=CAMNT_0050552175 /DNA_START=636 /DNA_END=1481 /DNA_ORIENTATION=-